jgi:hypothetical protein
VYFGAEAFGGFELDGSSADSRPRYAVRAGSGGDDVDLADLTVATYSIRVSATFDVGLSTWAMSTRTENLSTDRRDDRRQGSPDHREHLMIHPATPFQQ